MLLHTTVPSYPLHLLLRPACLAEPRREADARPEEEAEEPAFSPPAAPGVPAPR